MSEGAIVRNKRTGAMGRIVGGQVVPIDGPAPSADPIVKAAPAPSPKNPYDIQTDQRDFRQGVRNTVVDDAGKLRGEFNGLPQVKEYQTVIRQYDSALKTEPTPTGDQALITAYAKMLDPTSVVREQEFETVAAGDSAIGKAVAQLQKELGVDGAGMLRPEVRERVRNEMLNLVKGYNSTYNQARQNYETFAQKAGVDPGLVVGEHLGAPFFEDIKDARQDYYDSKNPQGGNAPGADPAVGYDEENGLRVRVTDDSPDQAVVDKAAEYEKNLGAGGISDLAKQGVSLGLSDNATGVGEAIAGLLQGDLNIGQNYRVGRDAWEMRLEDARQRTGMLGTAAEITGGFALPGSALAGGVGAATKGGAIAGFLGGAGYGESANNALLGAAGGAVLGYGGQRIGNALANRSQAGNLGQRARDLNAAGQAEGVTVNRAMVDPQSNNAITKADATLIGGRTVQREMGQIEGQIGGRVSDLGRGGQAMDKIATGDKVKGAGERFIDRSGKAAKAKYDRAEQLAGNAKVAPQESLQVVDDAIATLQQTPNSNKAEISFLEGLKADLSQDLSVGALRRMRTSLRKKISRGELVFGEDEARVLSVMDAAANDIRNGLTAQGKQGAARAFDAADKAYRARMDYINGTVQKLIGKRGANLSAEQIAGKFNSMANTDARGLRKFYATLDPSEQADVSATFAEQLGKNNKGEFSVAHFLSQSEKMSDETLRTIFGPQGAESVKNLRTLGKEVNRVTGAMNSRTSKSGVASYRDWLWTLATGGGGLIATSPGTAAGAAGAVAGATAVKQILSARSLMSPKITKWLRQAPATTSPAAINSHYARLGEIAKAEPALAAEIDQLRKAIMGAANDNAVLPTQAAANESDNNGGQ